MITCIQDPRSTAEDEVRTIQNKELLTLLAGFSMFGIAHVQRVAKVGYQRAVNMVLDLEAGGSIIYIPQSKRWRIAVSKTELKAVYEQHKAQLKLLPELAFDDVQPVIVMNVPEKWASAEKRVLLVGQETMGWDFEPGHYYDWPYPPIKSLGAYLEYDASVGAMMHGYQSFEFAAHQPNYNSPFWRAYRQIRLAVGDAPDGFDTSVLHTNLFKSAVDGGSISKLFHPALPEETYRTYHPNYLSRGHWHLVDELCELVRQA